MLIALLALAHAPAWGQDGNLLNNADFEAALEDGEVQGWNVHGYQMGAITSRPDTDWRWSLAPGQGWEESQALRVDNLTGVAPPSLVTEARELTHAAGPYRFAIRLRSLDGPLRLRFFVIDERFQVKAREHLFAGAEWSRFAWEGQPEGRLLFRLDVMTPGSLLVDDAALTAGIQEQRVFIGHRRSDSAGPDKLSYVIDAREAGEPLPDFHGVCYLQGHSGPRVPPQLGALPLRFVRNHNVLSHLGVVRRGPDGGLIYEWDRLDATVREIIAIGAVPVMSLTFVPPALVRDPDPAKVYGPYYAGPPDDLSEWQGFISEVVRHCRESWDIRAWWWVFGNEPDLPQFAMGTREQFYELYRATVEAALRVEPELRVGAGGFLTDKIWLRDFVTRCARDGTPLRVLTWHEYGTLPADLPASLAESRAILDTAGYRDTPLAVDEWNLVEDDGVPYNADPRGAAYLLSAVKAWADAGGLAFHTYFISRAPAPGSPQRPGFGLLARDSEVVRPTYNAFRMLGMLGGRRLSVNGGDPEEPYVQVLATLSPEGDVVRVLAWNLHHPSDRGPGREKQITLTLEGWPERPAGEKARLEAQTLLLDRTHSNSLHDPERAELESGPTLVLSEAEGAPARQNGERLRTTFSLQPNSVLLLAVPR